MHGVIKAVRLPVMVLAVRILFEKLIVGSNEHVVCSPDPWRQICKHTCLFPLSVIGRPVKAKSLFLCHPLRTYLSVSSVLHICLHGSDKIHADEPDILWVMGWCYIPGVNNGSYAKHIVLNRAEGESYTAVPADWHKRPQRFRQPPEHTALDTVQSAFQLCIFSLFSGQLSGIPDRYALHYRRAGRTG